MDADKNVSTGSPTTFAGYDYEFIAYQGQGHVFAWNGTRYAEVSPPSFKLNASGTTQQFVINRADLGNTSGFTLYASTISYDGELARIWDRIPDSGLATYDLAFPVNLTVAKVGTGTIGDSGNILNCGATCTAVFQQGQSVTLIATPDADSTFAGWEGGGCSGTSTSCMLTLDADTTVTATFAKRPARRLVSLTVSKLGRGTVVSRPAGIACGRTCSADLAPGPVTLTARPSAGFALAGWRGACRGSKPTCRLSLIKAASVTAVFTKKR